MDFSSAERRRVMDALEVLRQEGTVDELGLGGARDTLADVLAPGLSTIQTRARYFFFLPWMYQALKRRGITHEDIEAEASRAERALIDVLKQSDDLDGIVGVAAGQKLKRLPSELYWSGLRTLGIREFDGSIVQFHRAFDQLGAGKVQKDDGGMVLEPEAELRDWNPRLPRAPSTFPKVASLALAHEEAVFLAGQLERQGPESLFRFLVACGDPGEEISFPWDHPKWAAMPVELRRWLDHGRNFSELMHGASLAYNILVAISCENDRTAGRSPVDRSEQLVAHQASYKEWVALVAQRKDTLAAWDYAAFFRALRLRNPRLSQESERFSAAWIGLVREAADLASLPTRNDVRTLIGDRERAMKRELARLYNADQRRNWGGASGINRLDYRWGITRVMARDIIKGLGATAHA